jgi:hypothetical protein
MSVRVDAGVGLRKRPILRGPQEPKPLTESGYVAYPFDIGDHRAPFSVEEAQGAELGVLPDGAGLESFNFGRDLHVDAPILCR